MSNRDKPAGRAPNYLPPLLAVSAFFGKRVTEQTLLSGLPAKDGILPSAHIAEAAERAKLSVDHVSRPLSDLQGSEFPVIAELDDGRVIAILKAETEGFLLGGPNRRTGWIDRKSLADERVNSLYALRPQFFYDHRSLLTDLPDQRSWLMSPLFGNWRIDGFAIIASLFVNITVASVSLFNMAVYDRVIPNNALYSLWALLIGAGLLITLDFFMKWVRGYLLDTAGRRFDMMVGSQVFARMMAVRPEHRSRSSGTLANLVREFDGIRDFFTSATLITLADLPFVTIFLLIIWLAAGNLVLVPVAAIVIILGAVLLLRGPMKRAVEEGFRNSAAKSAFLYETAIGIDVLRAGNGQAWARRQWEGLLARNGMSAMRSRQLSLLSLNTTGTVATATTIATVAVGALMVMQGEITTGALIAATILSGRVVAPFSQVANLLARWEQTKTSISALNKLMSAPSEEENAATQLQSFTLRGAIDIDGATYAYPPDDPTAGPPKPAVARISAKIRAGEQVGIVGRVGSGKSTLLSLLLNIRSPSEGHIVYDGVDARQIHPAELRRQIGYAGQESVLFHGTILDNITLANPEVSDDAVLEAAQIVGLDDLLKGSALGLATPVGEQGKQLSGGLRQSVALARAIVHRPPVLILDEPTSMMDHTTENLFLKRLQENRTGLTTIISTHRTAPLAILDRLMVMDGGQLVLDGPRDAVLAKLRAMSDGSAVAAGNPTYGEGGGSSADQDVAGAPA